MPTTQPKRLSIPPPPQGSMPTPLEGDLRARIHEEGPIPFRAFMEAALYHEEHGYYAQEAFTTGREGDFATAPDAGPLLGATLAEPVVSFADEPGRLVEVGPGSGRLMEDILTALEPDIVENLDIVLVEPHAARQDALAARFHETPGTVRLVDDVAALDPARTFLLANEVLDALPCEVLRNGKEGWQRLHVDVEDEAFVEAGSPAPEDLASDLSPPNDALPVGHRYEAAPSLAPFLGSIQEALDPGVALFMDYGGTFEDIWPRKPEGTLRGFREHDHASPLTHPGRTDITYDVDFSRVQRIAHEAGLRTAAFGPQERMLVHLGVMRIAQDQDALLTAKQLVVPTGFGARFKTLVLDQGGTAEQAGLRVDLDDPGLWDAGLDDVRGA